MSILPALQNTANAAISAVLDKKNYADLAAADSNNSSTGTTSSDAATITAPVAAATTSSTVAARASLSSDFHDFLNMLMTQLKNQDPSDPLNPNQFTSELVQFSQVEQQLNTNSSLKQLIALTQAQDVLQSSSMLGKTVSVNTDKLPLQNGKASLSYTTSSAQDVAVNIYNAAGNAVYSTVAQQSAGNHTFTWNGEDSQGATLPDGVYTVAVSGASVNGGKAAAIPFTINGSVNRVTNDGSSVDVWLGSLEVPFNDITSVNS